MSDMDGDAPTEDVIAHSPINDVVRRIWGYDQFRPLQFEAMESVRQGRDSVVVMPTGGGKSLCYQAPALCVPGLALVVSPLISLMKDQVDTLIRLGVPAACVNSSLDVEQRKQVARNIQDGRVKLLYLSPERMTLDRTISFLQSCQISFIAIDEAHCISDWGHDFRPDYRMLKKLRGAFPGIGIHAFTATATERVRNDIARELDLRDPNILVGSFDRPNLTYRVQRRRRLHEQIRDVLDRHPGKSGIIYAIRRTDVDQLASELRRQGIRAVAYHAGLTDDQRRRVQEDFIQDRAQVIVATVAFGMGIDKPDVRFVIHAAAPKSLEAYQQESGRAGRDGLPSECWLFYSYADFMVWKQIQRDLPEDAYRIALRILANMESYCSSPICRHQTLVRHFGQSTLERCQDACDICLGEQKMASDPLPLAQAILKGIIDLGQRFGPDYVAAVLAGDNDIRIIERGHERGRVFGSMAGNDRKTIRFWIDQLALQGFLTKEEEMSILSVTKAGMEVLAGRAQPSLSILDQPKSARKGRSNRTVRIDQGETLSYDEALFDTLRQWRRRRAEEKGVPAYVIVTDATLRNLAAQKPTSPDSLLQTPGIGPKKLADYGQEIIEEIARYAC